MSQQLLSPRGASAIVDALVCGGGPAGSVVAAALAARGHSVIVVERSRFQGPRVGEHLPPNAQPLLEQLGLWERFRAGPHLPCPGVRAAWGDEGFREQDYLFNPYGQGWNLDRGAFDATLADGAIAAGAEVLTGARVATIERRDETWLVRLGGGVHEGRVLSARIFVDATGRAAALARRFGSRRRVVDNLVALCAWTSNTDNGENRRLIVESVERGWWYTTPLPHCRRVAVLLSDRDLVPGGAAEARALWAAELARTRTIRSLVDASKVDAFHVRAANTYLLEPIVAEGWLAVGDAASAFDPLSSMGILKALRNGVAAAGAITRWLAGENNALAAYAGEVEDEFTRYIRNRHLVYAQEHRWPRAPFWHRRVLTTDTAESAEASSRHGILDADRRRGRRPGDVPHF